MSSINIQLLNDLAKIPTRGSEEAAGWDLYAATNEEITIEPHQTVQIGTGIAMELPLYSFGAIFARSGLATKKGLRPANAVGVIDSDYRGEIIIALHNDTDLSQTIAPQERIAQLVIIPYVQIEGWNEVDELDSTDRGDGGFGSTGTV